MCIFQYCANPPALRRRWIGIQITKEGFRKMSRAAKRAASRRLAVLEREERRRAYQENQLEEFKRRRFQRVLKAYDYQSSGPDARFGTLLKPLLGLIIWRFCGRRLLDIGMVNKHWYQVAMADERWQREWERIPEVIREAIPTSWTLLPYHTRLYQVMFRRLFLGSGFGDGITYLEPTLTGQRFQLNRVNGELDEQSKQHLMQLGRYFVRKDIVHLLLSGGVDKSRLILLLCDLRDENADNLLSTIPNFVHAYRTYVWYEVWDCMCCKCRECGMNKGWWNE